MSGNQCIIQDSRRLRLLREAMELFTLLSFVNNGAFSELVSSGTVTRPVYFPIWNFRVAGRMSANKFQTPVTWGTLLGLSDGLWEYSPGFLAAVEQLEAMGVEESTETREAAIYWEARLGKSTVDGRQKPGTPADLSSSPRVQLRRLFDAMVPPVVHLMAVGGGPTLAALSKSPCLAENRCQLVGAAIRNLADPVIPELAAALASTATRSLSLDLERATINSYQTMMNAGFLMNTLVCGSKLIGGAGSCSSSAIPGRARELSLWCFGVCDRMFSSICSAVAELSTEANVTYDLFMSERWPWLIYALCCGLSDTVVTSVTILRGTLKKSDILVLSAVLQTNYPQPILESSVRGSHAYGFVDVREESELYLSGVNGASDSSFILSNVSSHRYRALYDPTVSGSRVTVIVPGYGVCQAKLEEGVKFTPDPDEPVFIEKRISGSLILNSVTFESCGVLMELLTLITRNLRLLKLGGNDDAAASITIDLSALSSACPGLQHLVLTKYGVVVSAYDESLRRWPIKTIALREYPGTLSDLIGCLRDTTLRMARELVQLEVTSRRHVFDENDMKELRAYDRQFLPVIKKKLQASSKAAMISVVVAAPSTTKPIHRLDANILALIFVFASTPEQRSVECWWK